jgi:DNA-binding Lrp family transcriptional regulator
MPKNSNEQLVLDEQKILTILQKNAHETIDGIAKKCGFSRQKVWRIVKKLEKEKIIWGYTAVCDNELYGLKHFVMLGKRTPVPFEKKTINEILTTKLDDILPGSSIRIENIEFVHGVYDGIFTFWADNLITAKRFCERFSQRFSQYIANYELFETIITIRRQSIQNPRLKEQIKYL